MIRFVETAVRGGHLGIWVYNNGIDFPQTKVDGVLRYHRMDRWLIDGQQRLTALDRFFDDKFPVLGKFWSETTIVEKRLFLSRTEFGAFETMIDDERKLRMIYDTLNYGGVPHTQEQRALPENGYANGIQSGR